MAKDRLTGSNHPESERQDSKPHHFQMLYSEWQTDNGNCENQGEEQVYKCQLQTPELLPSSVMSNSIIDVLFESQSLQ